MKVTRTNTILYCRNWQATVEFYKATLELTPTVQKKWFLEFRVSKEAYLSVADEGRTSVKAAGGAGITISFRVEDAEELREELIAKGAEPGKMRQVWGSSAFFIRDPEGNRLEFWS